jgi:hypothetical protein
MKYFIKIVAIAILFVFSEKGNAQIYTNSNNLGLPGSTNSAIGESNIATGNYSFASGYGNSVTGNYGFSLGRYNATSGNHSFSLGTSSLASGYVSFSIGYATKATGEQAYSIGSHAEANGYHAYSFGNYSIAGGANTYAFGYYSEAIGANSFSIGNHAVTNGASSFTLGSYLETCGSFSMAIGKGVNSSTKLGNDVENSLMVGFNSNIPTFFVGGSAGVGTTGNVGIGTSRPTTKLNLRAYESPKPLGMSTECAIKIVNQYANTFGANTEIQFGIAAGVTSAVIAAKYTNFGNGKTGSDLILGTQSTLPNEVGVIERMRITHDGNVGIGTAAPASKLDVKGGVVSELGSDLAQFRAVQGGYGLMLRNDGANSSFLLTDNNNPYGGWNGYRPMTINNATGDFYVHDGGAIYARASDHYVGIGSTNPRAKLDVNGAIAWGNTGATLSTDQGASIELRGVGTTFIDFTNDAATDYDMRLILMGDDVLHIDGGDVGIGTSNTQGHKLAVKGSLIAEDVFVRIYDNWPDYVFAEEYALSPLSEVESFINENNHLPNVPSQKEVEEKGINLGEMDAILLQKIEELTLYTIKQQKLIEQLLQKR